MLDTSMQTFFKMIEEVIYNTLSLKYFSNNCFSSPVDLLLDYSFVIFVRDCLHIILGRIRVQVVRLQKNAKLVVFRNLGHLLLNDSVFKMLQMSFSIAL